jgi:fatty acid synthase
LQKVSITEPRPIWFIYSGMGSQWAGMGQKLMQIPTFAESIHACSKALEGTGIDLYGIIMSENPDIFKNNTLNCMLGICAIQVRLLSLLAV